MKKTREAIVIGTLGFVAVLVFSGCDSTSEVEGGAAIRTEGASFALAIQEGTLVGEIPFRYRNEGAREIELKRICGIWGAELEQGDGDGNWHTRRGHVIAAVGCDSPTVSIRPGGTILDTFRINPTLEPDLEEADLVGLFRLRVGEEILVEVTGSAGSPSRALPLDQRVSNEFVLHIDGAS